MTEHKRFTIDNESDIVEFDWTNNEYIQEFMWRDGKSWDRICNRLNELYDENKQLKILLQNISDQRDEFHRGARENANRVGELEKENEQLKQTNQKLYDDLQITKSFESLHRGEINILRRENEQLKQSVNNFKDTIIKITIAYQRKYDRTIVRLVNEIYDEDITDLIKELKE